MSSQSQDIFSENYYSLDNYLQLIYIALLSLEIDHKITTIPKNKTDLNFVITSVIKIIKKSDELIYRAVSLWEQINSSDNKEYYGIVKKYLETFNQLLNVNGKITINLEEKDISIIAFKMLTDLLFYSSMSGERLLRNKLELLFDLKVEQEENNEV
ncbi:DUF3038 domain-containing protein [Cyanobacterium stanieri LEGE 03274]|uniref:DUF3038 domain-containing protein n=1 Tax=Cyanobacterium stanieri LEGE 03274 TaxID=1828756 RepID=A0ABR9V345_9CHRO|nr:DUF3038 domain-containing protein [Cyanobacterium stanieri]MBE9222302.1 DUF3038 domain-containing protein [Cyanobacterium stanieri LEGE 03274]